jgi:hypothetical protein
MLKVHKFLSGRHNQPSSITIWFREEDLRLLEHSASAAPQNCFVEAESTGLQGLQ